MTEPTASPEPSDFLYRALRAFERPGPHNWRDFQPFQRCSPPTERRWRNKTKCFPYKLKEFEEYLEQVEAHEAQRAAEEAMSTRTPATRRSARLASNEPTPSAPGAFADPISSRTRRASATPSASAGRLRRGRAGATTATAGGAIATLPPIHATNSHAYGASGRASIADPSRLGTSYTSPNLALDTARDTAVARQQDVAFGYSPVAARPDAIPEESDAGVPWSRQTSAEPITRRSSLVPISRHSSTGPDDLYGDTIADTSRSFGAQHEAGIVLPHGFQVARPTRFQVFRRWFSNRRHAINDYMDDIFPEPGTMALVGLFLGLLFAWTFGIALPHPSGASLLKARDSLYNSMSSVARVTGAHVDGLRHDARFANLDKELADQRNRYEDLSGRYDIINAELEKLKDMLPDLIVVRRKQDSDGYELLDHFWDALEAKAAGEHPTGSEIPWDKWFNRNQEMVAKVQKSMSPTNYDAIFAWGLKHYSLLTKDEVLKILKEHYQEFDAKYAATYDKFSHVHDQTIERVTERYLSQRFSHHKYQLVEGAWAHKTIENARLSLERPNFMSAKLGANIDPHLTSPTARNDKGWRAWIYGRWLAAAPPPNPPIEALLGWEEAGDCWCSAQSNGGRRSPPPSSFASDDASDDASADSPPHPDGGESGRGKAQLGIQLAQAVYPTHLVLEHVPKAGTLSPGSAPRDVELWAHVPSPVAREALEMQLDAASWNGDDKGGRCGSRGATIPEEYVCVGTTRYDIEGWNHVQMSEIEVDFRALQMPVSKVVVRVQDTWGKDRVCIYRVRLLGEPA